METTKEQPLVSVIVTTYNRKELLKETIDSILNQTFRDFELIVVDNYSNYDFLSYMKSFNDSRIRSFQNQNNGIIVVNRNYGIKKAKGEYIAVCDDDDLWLPLKLEKQVEFLNSNQEVAVVGSHYMSIDENGNYLHELKWPVGSVSNFFYILTGHNPVGHPCVMYKKKVIEEVGYYREEYSKSEDTDLWFRIYHNGYRCDNIPQILTYYRKHSKQASTVFKDLQHKNHSLAFFDFYTKLVKKEISYNKIVQYLNVLVWKTEHFSLNNLWNIIYIFMSIFEKLKFIHRCNNSIIYFYPKIFRPLQLLGLIGLLLKNNTLPTSLIKSILKRIKK